MGPFCASLWLFLCGSFVLFVLSVVQFCSRDAEGRTMRARSRELEPPSFGFGDRITKVSCRRVCGLDRSIVAGPVSEGGVDHLGIRAEPLEDLLED